MKKVTKRTRKPGQIDRFVRSDVWIVTTKTRKQILEGLQEVYRQLAFLDGSHIVKSQEFPVNYKIKTTKELSFINNLEKFFSQDY